MIYTTKEKIELNRTNGSRNGYPTSIDSTNSSWASGLQTRQLETLELMSKGYSNAEIAEIMLVRPRTVENQINKINKKLPLPNKVDTRVAAVLTYLGLENMIYDESSTNKKMIDTINTEIDIINLRSLFDDPPRNTELEKLTDRGLETLELMSKGYNNTDIAENMSVAESTVGYHINDIYRTLSLPKGSQKRVAAVLTYLELRH